MIGVVGAGITGLTLAHELRERGCRVRVWEARDRAGGVVRTEDVQGLPLDLGPQRTRLTPDVEKLLSSLGLSGELIEAPPGLPLLIYRGGRLREVPFSFGAAVRSDLFSWRAKARALIEPFIVPRRAGETVEGFFVRNFGREIYESLLGPLYGGLYASDPARMPVHHALGRVLDELQVGPSLLVAFLRRGGAARDAMPTVSFRDGLETLPRALACDLGNDLRLSAPVERLIPGPMGRIMVEVEGRIEEMEALVLTCPAASAAHILRQADPEAAEVLSGLTYNPLAVVHLRSSRELRGLGYQVAFGESLETRGVTWNASMFGRDGVYTAYLGGMKNPSMVDEDDEAIGSIAATEFEMVTGCDAEVLHVSRTAMPAWDTTWDALGRVAVPPGVHLCANYTGRPGIPSRIRIARGLAERLSPRR